MRSRVWVPAGIFAAAALLSASYAADPLPKDTLAGCAVSAPNAKFGISGGTTAGAGVGQITGSFSSPVGCAFGLQVDGALTSAGATASGGVAAHLFRRDPSVGLLGITTSYENGNGVGTLRVGPELEAYFGAISVEGWAGYASASSGPQDWFAAVNAAIYPTDDLRLSAGWRHSFGTDVGVARAEYQPPHSDAGVFVEGRAGAQNYSSVKVGMEFHLGAPGQALIARHRTSDPQSWLFDLLAAKVNSGTGPGPLGCAANPTTLCDDHDRSTTDTCNIATGVCSNVRAVCGNGIVEPPEVCDGPVEGLDMFLGLQLSCRGRADASPLVSRVLCA